MKPLYVRKMTEKEVEKLKQGLRSSSAFTVRRSQILLKSGLGQKAQVIAEEIHCSDQTVREVIRAFDREGLSCLQEKSRARLDQQALIDEQGSQRLQEIIRLVPRTFGYETSVWTRPLLAEVLHQEGYTKQVVSPSNITGTLRRVGIAWQRAKDWVRSPDPHFEHRKKDVGT
jgi:transposase